MEVEYLPSEVEKIAQDYWERNATFTVIDPFPIGLQAKHHKFYCLSMFMYPSGNIHMGHVRNFTIGDVISRFKRMQGKVVLQPTGWDAFGLPAENAALQHGISPATWTYNNITRMKSQLKSLGFAYDWQRELTTSDPSYYRWEQWFFIQLYNKGLAYKKHSVVNWDPVDQTVLANEQVINGRGWRSNALIERKEISQWFIKITDYAEELLTGLDNLDDWPEQVKAMQRNWIGKSIGLNICFKSLNENLWVFTTRPDTLMGVTFLAIAANHPLVKWKASNNLELQKFLTECSHLMTSESVTATIEKTGMYLGEVAIHPISGEHIPIWVTNYVLMDYGTGALMGVPAHDERDFEFSKKYNLPIKQVIGQNGILINSGKYNGLNFEEAFTAILSDLSAVNVGSKQINYRLRDWGISRQRYWGAPIPMIYCHNCKHVPVDVKDLPVILPSQVVFSKTSTLKTDPDFYQVNCPKCGEKATRDTDTFDTFFESSWYYARFACWDQNNSMLDPRVNFWTPVDQYIGGIEHAILHLLYARFFHKAMRDLGLVNSDEPFTRLLTQGMVLKDGFKMSKSKGNTVEPEDLIKRYGADTARLFIMFAAPIEQSLEWSDKGVEGAFKFLKRLWHAVYKHIKLGVINYDLKEFQLNNLTVEQTDLRRKLHITLKKVTDDLGKRYSFNTAIAAIMELMNQFNKFEIHTDRIKTELDRKISQEVLELVVLMLSPIVPHITHSLWYALGGAQAVIDVQWPEVDLTALIEKELCITVQINGRVRANLVVNCNEINKFKLEQLALELPNVKKHLQNQQPKKIIHVGNKLLNIVL